MQESPPSPPAGDVLVEAFFPLAPVALALVDEDMRYIRVNEAHAELVGMPAEDHVGRHVGEVVPSALGQVEPVHERVMRGEPIVDVEVRAEVPAQPGVERCFLVSYYPVEVAGRRAVGAVAIDITKRVEADQALRESEERFRGLFDHALVGMDLVDCDGRLLQANPALCEMVGRSEHELRAIGFAEITHPDDREASRAAFRRLVEGEVERYTIDKRYVRPDGEVVWARLLVAGVRDEQGALRQIIGQQLDLTAEYRATERMRAMDAQFQRAQHLGRIGSWEWFADTGAGVWSDELYRIHGLEPGSVEPSVEFFHDLIHPDDRDLVWPELTTAASEGRSFSVDMRIVHPSGAVRAITFVGEPVRNERGDVKAFIGTVHDVTERRRRETEGSAVARLREHALEGWSVTRLAQDATEVCARILGVEYGGVLVALPHQGGLRLIAGVGWPRESVGVSVLPLGSGSHPGFAYSRNEAVVVEDWHAEKRFPRVMPLPQGETRSAVVVPIPAGAEPFGVLGFQSLEPNRFMPEDVDFLTAVAGALGTAIERRRSEDRIAALAEARGRLVSQTLNAEDETRRQISELLHDQALQELLAARQDLAEAAQDESRAPEHAARAQEGVERAIHQLRNAVADLHPVVLEHGGLASALVAVAEHQARRGGFTPAISVDPGATGRHDKLVLSLARELLHNAAKHADAANVSVRVGRRPDAVVLQVSDDGHGFDPEVLEAAVLHGHIGLASHAERVDGVGGRLEIDTHPGVGTTIRVVLPVAG